LPELAYVIRIAVSTENAMEPTMTVLKPIDMFVGFAYGDKNTLRTSLSVCGIS